MFAYSILKTLFNEYILSCMNGEYVENFDEVVTRGEALYKTLEKVRCPFFESDIHFNAKGIEHLKFKRQRQARPRQDQYMRFKLLYLVPEVLRLSRTVQGVWETKQFERRRIHSRTENTLVLVKYYEFIAVLKGVRIKIIVKQVDGGELFFWSVIPFWGISKETKKRKMHAGNPEED